MSERIEFLWRRISVICKNRKRLNHFLTKNKAEAFLELVPLVKKRFVCGAVWDPLDWSGGSYPSQVFSLGPTPLVFGPKVTCEQGCPHLWWAIPNTEKPQRNWESWGWYFHGNDMEMHLHTLRSCSREKITKKSAYGYSISLKHNLNGFVAEQEHDNFPVQK